MSRSGNTLTHGEHVRDTSGESAVTRVVLSSRKDFSVRKERRLDTLVSAPTIAHPDTPVLTVPKPHLYGTPAVSGVRHEPEKWLRTHAL